MQDAAVHFRHLVSHHHSKFSDIRVGVEVGTSHLRESSSWMFCSCLDRSDVYSPSPTHQFANFILPVWRRPRGGTDHRGGLIVRQLFDAALPSHDVADLQ